jgi:AraC family transcriptional regulator, ethanolamine operon transcriptional activator
LSGFEQMTNYPKLEGDEVSPSNSLSTGQLLQRQFTDVDELASSLREGNVKITQLSLQPFQSHRTALCFEQLQIGFTRTSCSLQVVGDRTPGLLTFVCLPHGTTRPVVSHGSSITDDYLYGFDLNRSVNQVFPEQTTHCSIALRPDVFNTCAEIMDRPDLNARYFAPNYVYVPETVAPFRDYLKELHRLFQQQSPLLLQPNFQQIILQDLLPLLITTLPVQQDPLKPRIRSFQRDRLVKRATDYMQAHLDQPLTLTDLCQALSTSSRSLSYGFQDIFGLSPMTYLKILRLQGVYRALKTAEPAEQTIANIAHQFGFWSLGHFSRDYRQMFGQLPSETCRR